MWIELNEAEQRLSQFLAKSRYQANRQRGVKNKKIGPQSNEQTDLEGIGAEIAFCKAHNIYPDLQVNVFYNEDAITKDGCRVDIKATKYNNGHLIAVLGKQDKPPDAYALVIGEFPKYRIAGMITADDLLREERIKDFGYGPAFAAEQKDLN